MTSGCPAPGKVAPPTGAEARQERPRIGPAAVPPRVGTAVRDCRARTGATPPGPNMADPLLALDRAARAGRVRPGGHVLLLAAGTGYTWAASVLRWA